MTLTTSKDVRQCGRTEYYVHVCECGRRLRCDCDRSDTVRYFCAACEASITSTDIEAGYCTNCNQPLIQELGIERHMSLLQPPGVSCGWRDGLPTPIRLV